MKDKPTPETDKIAESLLYERADKRDYELRQHSRRLERERDTERALADRLAAALTDCMGDSEELLGERFWWKDDTRKSYQEDYNKTVTNYKRADFVIQQWKEARSE